MTHQERFFGDRGREKPQPSTAEPFLHAKSEAAVNARPRYRAEQPTAVSPDVVFGRTTFGEDVWHFGEFWGIGDAGMATRRHLLSGVGMFTDIFLPTIMIGGFSFLALKFGAALFLTTFAIGAPFVPAVIGTALLLAYAATAALRFIGAAFSLHDGFQHNPLRAVASGIAWPLRGIAYLPALFIKTLTLGALPRT